MYIAIFHIKTMQELSLNDSNRRIHQDLTLKSPTTELWTGAGPSQRLNKKIVLNIRISKMFYFEKPLVWNTWWGTAKNKTTIEHKWVKIPNVFGELSTKSVGWWVIFLRTLFSFISIPQWRAFRGGRTSPVNFEKKIIKCNKR